MLIRERIPCRLREIQPLSAEQHGLMPTWCKFTEITEGNKENNTERKKKCCCVSGRNLRNLTGLWNKRAGGGCQASEEQQHYIIRFTSNRVGQMDLVCVHKHVNVCLRVSANQILVIISRTNTVWRNVHLQHIMSVHSWIYFSRSNEAEHEVGGDLKSFK